MQLSPKNIIRFQNEILSWYQKHMRDLPWRKTRDPYRILVSEVMAQQTQLVRVIPKYEAWLTEFPTIQRLVQAKTSDVLRLWSGLGYNRRALYLQKAAKTIVEQYGGMFPQKIPELEQLPGIGKYTAGAIACFAFDQQVAVVDTNIRKVILTQFQNPRSKSQIPNEKEVQKIAEQLLPKGKAYEWNQALMDYAAAMLKKEKVPIPKQSRFRGSNRYYRGQIIKLLVTEQQVKRDALGKRIKPDFSPKDKEWLERILTRLARDGFVDLTPTEVRIK